MEIAAQDSCPVSGFFIGAVCGPNARPIRRAECADGSQIASNADLGRYQMLRCLVPPIHGPHDVRSGAMDFSMETPVMSRSATFTRRHPY